MGILLMVSKEFKRMASSRCSITIYRKNQPWLGILGPKTASVPFAPWSRLPGTRHICDMGRRIEENLSIASLLEKECLGFVQSQHKDSNWKWIYTFPMIHGDETEQGSQSMRNPPMTRQYTPVPMGQNSDSVLSHVLKENISVSIKCLSPN